MIPIAITIVTWNSESFIPDLLESIAKQSVQPASIIIVDNASSDQTVRLIENSPLAITLLRNPQNLGFAHAQNQAIALAKRTPIEGVLVTNPDIVLTTTFLETIYASFQSHTTAGSFSGKLLSSRGAERRRQNALIDSTGLVLRRSLSVVDRGALEEDRSQFDSAQKIFGSSGALCLYRLIALDDIQVNNELFDESFFAYKEDVDLAWRLNARGWEASYCPDAEAYHYRSFAATRGLRRLRANRRDRSVQVRRLSTLNHYRVLVKNVPTSLFARSLPWFLSYEFAKWVYLLFFEPRTLSVAWSLVRVFPSLLRQRRQLKKLRRQSVSDLWSVVQ